MYLFPDVLQQCFNFICVRLCTSTSFCSMFWNNYIFICRCSLAIRISNISLPQKIKPLLKVSAFTPSTHDHPNITAHCPPFAPAQHFARNCFGEVIEVIKLKAKMWVQPLSRPMAEEQDSQRALAVLRWFHSTHCKGNSHSWSDSSLRRETAPVFQNNPADPLSPTASETQYHRIKTHCSFVSWGFTLTEQQSSTVVKLEYLSICTLIRRGSHK